VLGLQPLREQICHDERVVGLDTRDAARALPLDLQLGHTALALFRDKQVVSQLEVRRPHVDSILEVRRPHVHLVVVHLNSSFAIRRSFLSHLCVDLGHSLRHFLNLHKRLRFYKVQRRVDRHVGLQHQRERCILRMSSEDFHRRTLFNLVDKKLFRTLLTMLTTSGHSSAYIFSSDSTAR
jgi:hypothetical protein